MLPQNLPSDVLDRIEQGKLPTKKALFVYHYLLTLNRVKAAQSAGYEGDYQSLTATAYVLMRDPDVREALKIGFETLVMDRSEVLARLAEIARGSIEDFFSADATGGMSLDLQQAQERGVLHLAKSYRLTSQGESLELYSKLDALMRISAILDTQSDDPRDKGPFKLDEWKTTRLTRIREFLIKEETTYQKETTQVAGQDDPPTPDIIDGEVQP